MKRSEELLAIYDELMDVSERLSQVRHNHEEIPSSTDEAITDALQALRHGRNNIAGSLGAALLDERDQGLVPR